MGVGVVIAHVIRSNVAHLRDACRQWIVGVDTFRQTDRGG